MSTRQEIMSNVIWKFAERIAAQLVSLIVSIVLARLLLPEDYGSISMVTVFITIADVFVTNGVPNALIQKKDADNKDFSSVFYFNLILSGVIYLILFVSASYISEFYSMDILRPVIRIMGLRIIISSVNSIQHSYVSRNMMFKKYFWSTLFGTLLSGVVGVILAYRGHGVWALVAQYMTNTCVDTLVLFITVKWRPTLYFSFKRIKHLIGYGWKILFEGLSSTFSSQLRNLIIGRVYTSSDLGFYTKGQQFPSLIVTNISAAISSVLFPAMSKEQDDDERIVNILRKSVRVISYVVYPMLTGLAVVAPAFVSVVLTDKWLAVIPYIRVFCVANALTVGMIPRHQALNAKGRSDIFMLEHIIGRVVNILLLIAVYKKSIMAIALSGLVGSCILLLIIFYTSKQYNGYSYTKQFQDLIPSLAGCVVMGVPIGFMNFLNINKLVLLVLQVTVGCMLYLIYSVIVKLEEFSVIMNYFKLILSRLHK